MSKIALLGVSITIDERAALLSQITSFLKTSAKKPLTIVTPNPEQIVLAQENAKFREILNAADVALPDGSGIAWAFRRIKNQESRIKQIPGIEFMESLVSLAAEQDWGIGLIGGRQAAAQETLVNLQKKHPGLKGWATDAPEVRIKNQEVKSKNDSSHDSLFLIHNSSLSIENYLQNIINRTVKTNTRILFIGLGAPKQEYLLHNFEIRNSKFEFKYPIVLMVVGGAFDELSGRIARPPKFVSDLGLKWLWRLLLEPWRLGRQLRGAQFFWWVLRGKK